MSNNVPEPQKERKGFNVRRGFLEEHLSESTDVPQDDDLIWGRLCNLTLPALRSLWCDDLVTLAGYLSAALSSLETLLTSGQSTSGFVQMQPRTTSLLSEVWLAYERMFLNSSELLSGLFGDVSSRGVYFSSAERALAFSTFRLRSVQDVASTYHFLDMVVNDVHHINDVLKEVRRFRVGRRYSRWTPGAAGFDAIKLINSRLDYFSERYLASVRLSQCATRSTVSESPDSLLLLAYHIGLNVPKGLESCLGEFTAHQTTRPIGRVYLLRLPITASQVQLGVEYDILDPRMFYASNVELIRLMQRGFSVALPKRWKGKSTPEIYQLVRETADSVKQQRGAHESKT